MEETIREHVAAIGVRRELDFVDREEVHLDVARHRLDRADIIAGAFGLDFLLARYKRYIARPDPCDDLVVDFTREEPQWQSYKPALVPEHSLDREVRLACIRRPQHRRYMPGLGWPYCSRLRCCAHKQTFCQNRTLRSNLSGFSAVIIRRGAPAEIERARLPNLETAQLLILSQ